MRPAVLLVSLSVLSAGGVVLTQGCYPDFSFTPSTGGGGSTGARPDDTSASTSSSTSVSSTHASSVSAGPSSSSSDAASSSSSGMMGPAPPCNTMLPCVNQQCCFNKTANADHCGASCESGYLSLACHDASDCPGGQLCCTKYDSGGLGPLLGTVCDNDCIGFQFGIACDPNDAVPLCTCDPILGSYYQGGTPVAPYDQYGECN